MKQASAERKLALKMQALKHSELEILWKGALTVCAILRFAPSHRAQVMACEESQSVDNTATENQWVVSSADVEMLAAIKDAKPSLASAVGHSNNQTALEALLPKSFAGKSGAWLRRTYFPLICAQVRAEDLIPLTKELSISSQCDDNGFDSAETTPTKKGSSKLQCLPAYLQVLNFQRLRQYVHQVKTFLNFDPLSAAAVQSVARISYVSAPANIGDTSESSAESSNDESKVHHEEKDTNKYKPPMTHKQRLRNIIKERSGKSKLYADDDRFGVKRGKKLLGKVDPFEARKDRRVVPSVFDFNDSFHVAECLLREIALTLDAQPIAKQNEDETPINTPSEPQQRLSESQIIEMAKAQTQKGKETDSLLHIILHHHLQLLRGEGSSGKQRPDLIGSVLSGTPISQPDLLISDVPASKFRTSIWKDMNRKRRQKNVSDRREREGKEVYTARDEDGDLVDYNLNRQARHKQKLSELCMGERQRSHIDNMPDLQESPQDPRHLSHYERDVVFSQMPLNNETVPTYFSHSRDGDDLYPREATYGRTSSALGGLKATGNTHVSLAQREIEQLAHQFTQSEINDEVWHGYSEGQNNKVISKRQAIGALAAWTQTQMRFNRRMAAPRILKENADRARQAERLSHRMNLNSLSGPSSPPREQLPSPHAAPDISNLISSRRTSAVASVAQLTAGPTGKGSHVGTNSERGGTSPSKCGEERFDQTDITRSNTRNSPKRISSGSDTLSVPNPVDASGETRMTSTQNKLYQQELVRGNYSPERKARHHYRDRATLSDRAYVAKMLAEDKDRIAESSKAQGERSTDASVVSEIRKDASSTGLSTLDRARRLAQSLPSERPHLRTLDKAGMAELLQSTALAPSVLYKVSDEYRKEITDIGGLRAAALAHELRKGALASQHKGAHSEDGKMPPPHLKYGAIKRSIIPPRPSSVTALRSSAEGSHDNKTHAESRPKTASATQIASLSKELRLTAAVVVIGGKAFQYDSHFAPRGQAPE